MGIELLDSILQSEKECYITGCTTSLEQHHIYKGSRRTTSDRNGFWVWLTPELHRGTKGVHGRDGHTLDLKLKQECQLEYEKSHTRTEFMKLIGRNYL